MDLTGVPAEVAPWIAIPVSIIVACKLGIDALKTLKDAREVGKTPPTPYELLEARLVKLELKDTEKATQIEALNAEVLNLRRAVQHLAGVLTREVASVLAWIAGGARPPAPHADIAFIRSVIADLEHEYKETP